MNNTYLLQYNVDSTDVNDDDNPMYPKKKLLTFVIAKDEEEAKIKLKSHIRLTSNSLFAYKINVIPTIK